MPYAMTVQKINMGLTPEALEALRSDEALAEQVRQPGSLVSVAESLLGLTADELEYLKAVPTVLQEAMRAAVVDAVAQGKAVQVQYSPAYDFEVRLWDFGQAVSVHLSGPYPPDFPRDRYLASLPKSD